MMIKMMFCNFNLAVTWFCLFTSVRRARDEEERIKVASKKMHKKKDKRRDRARDSSDEDRAKAVREYI